MMPKSSDICRIGVNSENSGAAFCGEQRIDSNVCAHIQNGAIWRDGRTEQLSFFWLITLRNMPEVDADRFTHVHIQLQVPVEVVNPVERIRIKEATMEAL